MVRKLWKNKNSIGVKKSRSRAYPALDLKSAILTAKKIFDDLGQGPHLRAALARGLGYGGFCGAVSAKIGALAHFGLLEKFAGNYSITPLALDLFDFFEKDCRKKIFIAATTPVLFSALAARFAGGALPKNLSAILASDYGIAANAAPIAAKNFVATFEFAGALKDNRLILPDDEKSKNDDDSLVAKKMDFGERADISAAENKNDGEEDGIEVALASGIKIIFPKKFAFRLAMGEFAEGLRHLDNRTSL